MIALAQASSQSARFSRKDTYLYHRDESLRIHFVELALALRQGTPSSESARPFSHSFLVLQVIFHIPRCTLAIQIPAN